MEKKKLNILLAVLAGCIVIVAIVLGVVLAGKSQGQGQSGKDSNVSGSDVYIEPVTEIELSEDGVYHVEIKTEGGMLFTGVGVYIYTDNTLEELVWFAKTNEEGLAEFTSDDATGYVVVLQDIPEGYQVQEYYYITGPTTEIILGTALKEGVDLSEISYSLGDIIHDFTVTTPDGDTYTVSEILEKKKAIVLNFWYVQCGPCKEEFPYINEAYGEYKDKIEVLAMNPVNLDDEEIAKYKKEMGLSFPMMQCEAEWATAFDLPAYPTTVVIDRYGVISLIHTGSLPDAEIFRQLFEFYSADDYKQTVVEDIYDIVTTELSQGTMDNPFELGGVLDFEITIRPDQVIYFNMYRVDKMNIKIEDADAYAIYKDETYYPTNGVVGLKVYCPDTYTPAFVGIGNSGTEKKTFRVKLAADLGTYENPYTLNLGEFTAKVNAGNDQGVFYEYRATENGALTLQCLSSTNGVKYGYYLQNMRTSQNRNLEYDSVTDKDGNVTVSVDVQKGDRVLVCISTYPDSSGNYPSGTFKMKASLGDASVKTEQYYGVSVVDDSMSAVSGVSVKLTCLEIEEIEGAEESTEEEDTMEVGDVVTLTTDKSGVASKKIRIGKYKAVVTVPTGYTADTAEYTLTKDLTNITFMLDRVVTEMKTYTVTVLDSAGKAIKDAAVEVGGRIVTTNSKGQASFSLPVGTYEAVVSKDGYVPDTCQFEAGKTELTVVLEKSAEDSSEKVTYTVTIKYDGTLEEDIYVQFMSDGVTKAMTTVNKTTKKATAELAKGAYTVELKFVTGSTLGCYTADLNLTETKRTLEVEVAEAFNIANISSAPTGATTKIYDSPVYLVYEGANPIVGMNVDEYTYFVFQPTESGVYKFSTNSTNAALTYWGANPSYIWNQTENLGDDYADNAFTLTIVEGSVNGGSYIVGLRGAQNAVLKIEKVGEVEAEIPYETYEATSTIKTFTYKGGTLTAFDPCETNSSLYDIELQSDGYYHLVSTGAIVYVDLDYQSLSMADLVASTALRCVFYDENGKVVSKVDYTDCLTEYVNARDEKTGYYPLTEDLKTIIQNGGGYAGWWDSDSPNYRFDKEVNEEIAWLFFCYY